MVHFKWLKRALVVALSADTICIVGIWSSGRVLRCNVYTKTASSDIYGYTQDFFTNGKMISPL